MPDITASSFIPLSNESLVNKYFHKLVDCFFNEDHELYSSYTNFMFLVVLLR
jgi:hypothetical protein